MSLALVLLAGAQVQAGDILRGGATLGQRSSKGAASGGLNAGAEQAKLNAHDALARTTAAMQSIQAMQAAARQAALKGPNNLGLDPNNAGRTLPNVPDGLVRGGLQVAPGVPKNLAAPQAGEDGKLWQGALLPKQRNVDGRTVVSIEQLKPQAVLNWQTFNIGKKTTLRFEQGRGGADKSQWIAFNKINDPSGSPSQILGKIEGDGQAYVINRNGIIFGGSSQINLHALVASSLPINDNLIVRGLLNNPNAEFLFAAPSVTDPSFKLPTANPDPAVVDSFAYTADQTVIPGTLTATSTGNNVTTKLVPGKHYTLSKNAAGRTVITFTDAAITKFAGQQVSINYFNEQPGSVVVKEGAQLAAPTSADSVGGRVMLVGPKVENHGTISTPDGQTLLVAGFQAGFTAHQSSDPTLRGLDAFAGQAGASSGIAVNTGLIDAPRANATMVGKEVNQLGVINSSTSVSLNGSVTLLASYGAERVVPTAGGNPFLDNFRTGTVTLGENSVTQILPELASEKKVVGSQLALRSQVTMTGRNIHFGADSTLLAPSASVALNAGEWGFTGDGNPHSFVYTNGQIYLESGSLLNVAGTTDVAVAIAQNILSLEFRGAELADSPLQRQGPLRATTLNLDIRQKGIFNGREWVGTPLGDAAGFAGLIERSVAELSTGGGSVTLKAGSSVVMQAGSKVDVSGGFINFQDGMVKTTRVMSDGRIVDIANATPDRPFTGLYDGTFSTSSPKYGVTTTWSHPLSLSGEHFEPGYVEGKDGGKITITAPSVALDGEMIGRTIAGPRQRTATSAPKLSALALTIEKQDPDQLSQSALPTFARYSPTPPAIKFKEGSLAPAAAFAVDDTGNPLPLAAERLAEIFLSPDLFTKFGFGSISVDNGDGSISIPEDVALKVPARGALTLFAGNLDVLGSISAPGGSLSFTAYKSTPYIDHRFPLGNKTSAGQYGGRGNFTLGGTAALSTAGLLVDDRPLASAPLTLPLALDGGSIAIAGFNVVLQEGSSLDVSGGVAFAKDAKRSYGVGGSISIKAGNDPKLAQIVGGRLELGARLAGFSGTKGGSLTIQAPSFQIGESLDPASLPTENTILLQPQFFSQGGFTNFTLIGLGEAIAGSSADFVPAIAVLPGTQLKPVALNYNALPYGGSGGGPKFTALLSPVSSRTPVNLTLSAPGVVDTLGGTTLVTRGDIIIGERARIETDPKGSITISGQTVSMLGAAVAPGGSVVVSGSDNLAFSTGVNDRSLTSVYLGPNSLLSAKGTVVYTPNPYGQRTGFVLPGGRVSVSGNIVADTGAVLDVSGATAVLDMAPAFVEMGGEVTGQSVVGVNSGVNAKLYTRDVVPTRVDSDAGEIVLTGNQHLFTDATLLGAAGGPSALGGTLTVSSGRFNDPQAPTNLDPLVVTLQVQQSGSTIPVPVTKVNGSAVRQGVLGADGTPLPGLGYFAVDSFTKGGFDSLNLLNTVEFVGPVSITARRSLSVATSNSSLVSITNGGVIYANAPVTLSAPYVKLGTPFLTPALPDQVKPPFQNDQSVFVHFKPTFGPGSLRVVADLIDIGNLSLQNIGVSEFLAPGGDIRGNGTLSAAGSILLRAAQIYPPTAVTFTIAASDYTIGTDTFSGRVVIEGSGTRQLPLSAGGQLNIYGSIIEQSGTIRAPLGGINLGWDGTGDAPINAITGEAVPVTKTLTLGPGSLTSVSAISPIDGQPLAIPYGLNVNGVTWIDPTGRDITGGGVAQKTVNIAAATVNSMAGSQIDIRGGGDLYAYRFVAGIGGTKDILSSTTSFAVVPSYGTDFTPYAPFNGTGALLSGAPGYVNSTLGVGDRIHLGASDGLPEGNYTLLPARYALLPGAFLVTAKAGAPIGTLALPDGSTMVPGYRFNDLNQEREMNPQMAWYEVLSHDAIRERSEFADYYGNDFLFTGALAVGSDVPRLPSDAGHLTLQAINAMTLRGSVSAQAAKHSRGGLVDIASPVDILITANGGTAAGKLVLSASQLSSFGAESLLIGGIRKENGRTSVVTVKTSNLTVDNAGTALQGPEVILVANKTLTLADGAEVRQEGKVAGGGSALEIIGSAQLNAVNDSIDFTRGGTAITFPNGTPGNDKITVSNSGGFITAPDGSSVPFAAGAQLSLAAGSKLTLTGQGRIAFSAGSTAIPITLGDGALLRVTSDPSAQVSRAGVASSTQPNMIVGAGVRLSGAGVTVDSTFGTSFDSTAHIDASSVSLNSGQISIQLDNPGALNPTTGLVLADEALRGLSSAQTLSLLSYSTFDVYGTGNFTVAGKLAIHAGAILGYNNGGGTATFNAGSLLLDNAANAVRSVALGASAPSSALEFKAGAITLGKNQLEIDQFDTVQLNASAGIVASGQGGLSVQHDLVANTPVLTAARAATQSIKAGGAFTLTSAGVAGVTGGLGASLELEGTSVNSSTNIVLASGLLKIRATTGDLVVNDRVNLSGTVQTIYDLVRYTSGGQLQLTADNGSVSIGAEGEINLSAPAGGGDAGRLVVSAPKGSFTSLGSYLGKAGAGGAGGVFALDAGNLPSFTTLEGQLIDGGFTESQSFRIRTGSVVVDGTATANHFNLSTDAGTITVNGLIDASGVRGGSIHLAASGNLILASGSKLTVEAEKFDSAGKGGEVFLETRGLNNGKVDIQSGSEIDLAGGIVNNPSLGHFTGTLHLRAPQISNHTDVAIAAIGGTINGASSIVVEGYQVFDLANTGGVITNAGSIQNGGGLLPAGANVQGSVLANGNLFLGTAGNASAGYNTMLNRLLGGNTALTGVLSIRTGAELINSAGAGNITLGTSSSNYSNDWNLAGFRFGLQRAPGLLTIRASGNLTLFNSISDGFATADWNSLLLTQNPNLPLNAQSWSYRFAAGADLAAADASQVVALRTLATDSGSLILGKDSNTNIFGTVAGSNVIPTMTSVIASNRYQVIRTGSGDITISTGRDLQLRNQLTSIYTAGTQVANAGLLPDGGTFDIPDPITGGSALQVSSFLGIDGRPSTYAAQYTVGGGNITITAQNDIWHRRGATLLADSSREMPTNWLYRRGNIDPVTGDFAAGVAAGSIDSTTWWVDFSNFFEGVGALGGGNVTLSAGRDVANVDAVAPTNARMPKGTPDLSRMVELGGGDVVVQAGRNIDGGVYYVERGHGTLSAGGQITTNASRTTTLGALLIVPDVAPAETWLPTTLFVGKSSFDVSARGNLLLGPVANPFLLPEGYYNATRYKTYFSTYSPEAAVNVASLSGDVTLRFGAVSRTGDEPEALLQTWYSQQMLFRPNPATAAISQPWLLLNETSVEAFRSAFALMPGTFRASAFSGNVNVIGDMTLAPSPSGTLELAAAGAVNGLNVSGVKIEGGVSTKLWSLSHLNLSDAPPSRVPSAENPLGFLSAVPAGTSTVLTNISVFQDFNALFAENGALNNTLDVKQALHAPGLLHAGDADPLRIYAGRGDISNLAVFSPKAAQIYAGRDISDIGLFIQNVDEEDRSIVAAGRDLVAYTASSPRRILAQTPGNQLTLASLPLSGDVQISGPGTLEVLAGRNIDLGASPANPSSAVTGIGLGIVSVGNARNSFLPFAGADLIVGAGVGPSTGISESALDFTGFISKFLAGPSASRYQTELTAILGGTGGPVDFEGLPPEQQNLAALQIFYLALRDAGRDFNVTGAPGFGNYDAGFAAAEALFPGTDWKGDLSLTAREIKTKSGGNVSIFTPGGKVIVGFDAGSAQALDQGILTESGGNIHIFAHDSVTLGTSRIFTLRGGNEIIWSSTGDIAAGVSSKTVQSAPPTRVLIDPQSADVKTDLAGLATGGGIGVLTTVQGVTPGDVDLIAPAGAIDAGDAGIRVSGNLNIAAKVVLNAENIQVTGSSASSAPAAPPAAPSVSVAPPPPPAPGQGGTQDPSNPANNGSRPTAPTPEDPDSIFSVEVLGYGGGSGTSTQ